MAKPTKGAHGVWRSKNPVAKGSHDHPLTTGNRHLQASVSDQGCRSRVASGAYQVITDEDMIEGLSFAAFRRVATMIEVPAEAGRATELVSIGCRSVGCAANRCERAR